MRNKGLCVMVFVAALSGMFVQPSADAPGTEQWIPSLYRDGARFESALAVMPVDGAAVSCVTGAIVPHHLTAIDVIARVLYAIRDNAYRTVLVLTPDHFFASPAPAATTRRSFQTPLGVVETDTGRVASLIDRSLVADEPDLFEKEHGIQAILPFIARLFPEAQVVPLALDIGMTGEQVDALAERLGPLIGPGTLVLLSSDFSHYLPLETAIRRDQETLNLLAASDRSGLLRLNQPDHVDSRAGLLVQTALQSELGSEILVLANENSQQYADDRLERTTSYVGAVYTADSDGACSARTRSAELCFGGDFITGRGIAPLLARPGSRRAIIGALSETLGDCPLVVNLESVLVPEPVVGAPPLRLWSLAEPAIELMRELGVVAVSVANNHSMDFGEEAYRAMVRRLRAAGIAVIEHGKVTDLGGVRVFGLTEITRQHDVPIGAIRESDFDVLRQQAHRPPMLAFVHWGRQFVTVPEEPQLELARKLRRLGVSGIVGAHPHRASEGLKAVAGGASIVAYSLGNLLFDQTSAEASAAVMKLRLFEQGTFFARQIRVENLFETAWAALGSRRSGPAVSPAEIERKLPPLRQRRPVPFNRRMSKTWTRSNAFP